MHISPIVHCFLRIHYLEHKTSDWVRSMTNFRVGPQEPLLATVKRRTLSQLGHVTRHDSLSKSSLRSTFKDGRRRRGRQKNCWTENIKEWTSLPIPSEN